MAIPGNDQALLNRDIFNLTNVQNMYAESEEDRRERDLIRVRMANEREDRLRVEQCQLDAFKVWSAAYRHLSEERSRAFNYGLFEIAVLSVVTGVGLAIMLPRHKIGLKENVLRMAMLIPVVFRAIIHLQRYFSYGALISNHESKRPTI